MHLTAINWQGNNLENVDYGRGYGTRNSGDQVYNDPILSIFVLCILTHNPGLESLTIDQGIIWVLWCSVFDTGVCVFCIYLFPQRTPPKFHLPYSFEECLISYLITIGLQLKTCHTYYLHRQYIDVLHYKYWPFMFSRIYPRVRESLTQGRPGSPWPSTGELLLSNTRAVLSRVTVLEEWTCDLSRWTSARSTHSYWP